MYSKSTNHLNSTHQNRGSNLIFLVSQPRAGSTLTQRILGSHSDIYTVSEPWLMLHSLYALRTEGYEAEYNSRLAQDTLKDFLEQLPNGEEAYFEGVRKMYQYLYESALDGSGKHYFLDKTPRYYYIIPELYRTFPEAHFVILLRNPLSVLCSIISTWTKENWFMLHQYKHDLIKAPILLLEAIELLKEQCQVLYYEGLLMNSEPEIRNICDKLQIEFAPEIIDYGLKDSLSWKYGDKKSVYKNDKPDLKNLNNWVLALENPQVWRVTNDYLQLLGQDTINRMGYSYEELQQIIDAYRPHWFKLWHTLPLKWLLKKPEERKKWEYEHYFMRLISSVQLRGFWGTVARLVEKLLSIPSSSKEAQEVLSS